MLAKKYSDIDTNTLFEMYLAAEGKEREKIAEALYQQGKRLCMHKYWSRYQDIPLDIADELYHEALIYALEKGDPKQNFTGLLVLCFVHEACDWLRRQRHRQPRPLPYDAIDIKEEMFWEWLADPIAAPAKLELRERLAQTLDCVMTLPQEQRSTLEKLMLGYSYKEIGKTVKGSVKDLAFHGRQNLQECLRVRHRWEDGDFVRLSSKRDAYDSGRLQDSDVHRRQDNV